MSPNEVQCVFTDDSYSSLLSVVPVSGQQTAALEAGSSESPQVDGLISIICETPGKSRPAVLTGVSRLPEIEEDADRLCTTSTTRHRRPL